MLCLLIPLRACGEWLSHCSWPGDTFFSGKNALWLNTGRERHCASLCALGAAAPLRSGLLIPGGTRTNSPAGGNSTVSSFEAPLYSGGLRDRMTLNDGDSLTKATVRSQLLFHATSKWSSDVQNESINKLRYSFCSGWDSHGSLRGSGAAVLTESFG